MYIDFEPNEYENYGKKTTKYKAIWVGIKLLVAFSLFLLLLLLSL